MNYKKVKSLMVIFFVFATNIISSAQDSIMDKKIHLMQQEYFVSSLLNELLLKNGVNLSYNNQSFKNNTLVRFKQNKYSLKEILDELKDKSLITYVVRNGIIIVKPVVVKRKFTVSGMVKDSLTGETIPYATISIKNTSHGTATNKYGFYSLIVPEGSYELVASYVGYKNSTALLKVSHNIEHTFELSSAEYGLNEVVVKADNSFALVDTKLSEINMKKIKEMPDLFGESDIIKSLQIVPGVTSAAEIGTSFNVRGGGVDQNLVLLDEAIVYNTSHLAGFYSVFNSDIIKDVKLYKGNIPSNYGGALSSAMDITQKEGNMKSFHINGAVSTIASKISLEGPIIKDKASFILAMRRSYVDMFFRFKPEQVTVDLENTKIHFYDINAKVNYKINDKNRIYLSSYLGHDLLKVDDYNQEYGNITTTLRYNHTFNNKLFSYTSIIYSDYKMIDGESSDISNWEDVVGLNHYQFKNEFNYYMYRNKIKFGFDFIYRIFHPGELQSVNDQSETNSIKIPDQHALESAAYFSDNISIGENIELQLGLRYSMFYYLGDESVFDYEEGVPRNRNTITDTIAYEKNEVIQSYNNFEPRAALKIKLNERDIIKLSYNKTAQYIHLVTNSIIPLPYNMWKPSNNNIEPLTGHQFSLGYFTSFHNNLYELSIETFYRKMENTLEVKPGANIVLNPTLDADLIEGEGKAYGLELLFSKTKGRLLYSASYTYLRSLRKVAPIYAENKIMPKGYYASDFDIPHQLTFVLSYKTGERSTLSANFVYMSGRPITLPDAQYSYFGTLLPYYSGKNQHRMPSMHRLDLSYSISCKKNKTRKWKGFWKMALYNVYARNNPYSIYLEKKEGSKDTQAIKFSVLSTIVPSLSYTFNF